MSGNQGPAAYTLGSILEPPRIGWPLAGIVGLCFLVMVCDSYDVAALSFVAPLLIKDWHVSLASMGAAFSAGLFGLLVGTVALGRIGDRIGRKRAIVLGALAFGLLTAATGLTSTYGQLVALRFLAALGLGGAIPNTIALVSEFAPQRLRITAVGAIFAGYAVGGIVAGVAAASIIPAHGWRMMFFVGGAMSLVTAVAVLGLLPESLRYLAATPSRAAEALRVAAFLRPDLQLGAGARLEAERDASIAGPGRLGELFRGDLKTITPLIWLAFIATSVTVYFLSSWMPVAVQAAGLSRGSAAMATSLMFTGSAIGGIVAGRFADRLGIAAVVIFALLAVPAVAALGMVGQVRGLVLPLAFLAGFCAFGALTCLNGITGSFYPTPIRASGLGWAIGIGKIGSILGPFIGGLLLARLSNQALFLVAASPFILVAGLSQSVRLTRRT